MKDSAQSQRYTRIVSALPYWFPLLGPFATIWSERPGNQVPSNILAEIDRKIDDGRAVSGFLRFSDYDGGVGAPDPLECYSQTGGHEWHASRSGANCGGAVLF